MNEYAVGFSTVEITPPTGTPIGGNFRSDYASRGICMPLFAQAMVVQNSTATVAIVSADLLVVTKSMVAEIRRMVCAQCGLRTNSILIAATHTHSGPSTMELIDGCMASKEVIDQLNRRIAKTVIEALHRVQPAEIKVGVFNEARLCFNRRIRMKDGSVRMNWERLDPSGIDEALGPVDPQGLLITVHRDDRLVGMLVNYALHPAVLAGANWDIGPDWPGYLRETLVSRLGYDIPIMYINGAQGNINHLDAWNTKQERGFKEAQRIGYTLADTVISTLRELTDVTGPLAISNEKCIVPRRSVDPQTVSAARKRLEVQGELIAAGQEDGMPSWFFDRELIDHAGKQNQPVETEVQTIRLGAIAFVALPGEFFVEWGLQLKSKSPAAFTIPVGLANDAIGYVPVPGVLEQGGYEGMTWRYNQLALTAGEQILNCALKQLYVLFDE